MSLFPVSPDQCRSSRRLVRWMWMKYFLKRWEMLSSNCTFAEILYLITWLDRFVAVHQPSGRGWTGKIKLFRWVNHLDSGALGNRSCEGASARVWGEQEVWLEAGEWRRLDETCLVSEWNWGGRMAEVSPWFILSLLQAEPLVRAIHLLIISAVRAWICWLGVSQWSCGVFLDLLLVSEDHFLWGKEHD